MAGTLTGRRVRSMEGLKSLMSWINLARTLETIGTVLEVGDPYHTMN
jgi:hypothetical protein